MIVTTYSIKRDGDPKYWYMLFQALDEDKKEIGYQEVEFMPETNIAYLIHIHVNKKHRHKGIATAIMDKVFVVLVEDMQIPTIEIPLYSNDGERYIKPLIDRYRQKYPQCTITDNTEDDILPIRVG